VAFSKPPLTLFLFTTLSNNFMKNWIQNDLGDALDSTPINGD